MSRTTPPRSSRPRGRALAIWGAAALVFGTALLATCLGGTTQRRSYFALEYPRGEAVQRYVEPRYPFVVRVRRFDAAIAYDRQEMVYRETPYEISYDWYRLWAAKPRAMVGGLVIGHLRDANLFRDVVERLSGTLPRYDLACELLALEELNASADEWYARLAMRCDLLDFETGAATWSDAFDVRRPVYQRHPRFVVRALSHIIEAELERMIDTMDAHLAAVTGLPAPAQARPAHAAPRSRDAPDAESAAPEPTGGLEPTARLRPRGP